MRKAKVFVDDFLAGFLEEIEKGKKYRFSYLETYKGDAVSHTMPLSNRIYDYNKFPPFFEGVLPEGVMLEGLLRRYKIDRSDYLSQLFVVGSDLVGNVTVQEDL